MTHRPGATRVRKPIQTAITASLVTLLTLAAAPAAAGGPPPELLLPDSARTAAAPSGEHGTVRTRAVRVERNLLRALGGRGDRSLRLSFFDDASFVANLREKKVYGPGRTAWHGDMVGAEGSVVVSVVGDAVLANVWSSHGSYELRAGPAGGFAREIDSMAYPPCGTDGADAAASESAGDATEQEGGGGAGCLEDGSVVDMLIVYTEEARMQYAGGTTAEFQALIQTMETSVNMAYANSGITPRLRVVGTLETDYQESGDSATDRSRLRNSSDGHMDEVHPLRDALAADIVSLVVHDIENCGRAYFAIGSGNSPIPNNGFHVVQRSCTVGNLSFAHELGHNQGSRHDTDGSDVPFDYSHGYNEGNIFRTVIAVCCSPTRVPHFSNPDVLFAGLPTGIAASADNARSMDETAQNVANFRCTLPDCSDGLDNDGDGLTDFPSDPGCDAAGQYSELSAALPCDDGDDNDMDGLTDLADPGCYGGLWFSEDPECNDGTDNDADTLTDLADPECQGPWDPSEQNVGCGLGTELGVLLPALFAARRRRLGAARGSVLERSRA